jgi:hypothetical protein
MENIIGFDVVETSVSLVAFALSGFLFGHIVGLFKNIIYNWKAGKGVI